MCNYLVIYLNINKLSHFFADSKGNVIGDEYDLGKNNAFSNFVVAVGIFIPPFNPNYNSIQYETKRNEKEIMKENEKNNSFLFF